MGGIDLIEGRVERLPGSSRRVVHDYIYTYTHLSSNHLCAVNNANATPYFLNYQKYLQGNFQYHNYT